MAARAYDFLQGELAASDHQKIGFSTQQFRRADKWAARIVDGAIFNDNVLSFAKTVLFQLRRKRTIELHLRRAARRTKKSYSREFSACCARAQNGHVSAGLQATRLMNSRRLMFLPPRLGQQNR